LCIETDLNYYTNHRKIFVSNIILEKPRSHILLWFSFYFFNNNRYYQEIYTSEAQMSLNFKYFNENMNRNVGAKRKRLSPILGWNIPVPTLNPPDGRDARWREYDKKLFPYIYCELSKRYINRVDNLYLHTIYLDFGLKIKMANYFILENHRYFYHPLCKILILVNVLPIHSGVYN